MALWEDHSGRHTGCARRFPHDSAVATPMWRGAGRNDPPRAPESESDGVRRAPPDALGVGGGAPARPRGPTPTTTRPRTPPDTPDEPPTTPRTRLNRLHQRSGQHRRSSPPTAPPTTGARTRVCYASFRLLRPSTLHCTRKESVVEGEGAQQTERSAAEGEAGAAGGEAGAAGGEAGAAGGEAGAAGGEAGAAEGERVRRRATGCIESSVVSAGLACLFRRFRRWGWRG